VNVLRQIVLDTETTGIGHEFGHRIIEIAGVELIDRKLTGKHFHTYLNPEREVDEGAFKVHGISGEFLQDKPFFHQIAEDFLQYIDGAELIIHNAPFDVGFLDAELKLMNWSKSLQDYARVLDTLVLAREKHPGQRNSLDALCKRYEVDNSNRQLHGALLDAEILAYVYLAMTGGQTTLFIQDELASHTSQTPTDNLAISLTSQSPIIYAQEDELRQHNEFVQFLVKKSGVNHWDA
jgi:DNA polymerase III subunit epsilon